jgi:hypothetical protein
MVASPAPASWAAIDGNARVVSLSVQYWANDDTKSPNTQSVGLYNYVIVNGSIDATNWQTSAAVAPVNVWTQSAVITLNALGPAYNTVAQLRQAGMGIGFLCAPLAAGQDPTNQLKVNGATVNICYRLPDSTVLTNLILPLLFNPN